MSLCSKCEESLPSVIGEFTLCRGPCNAKLCRSCTGLTKSVLKCVAECDNLQYYCENCKSLSIKSITDALAVVNTSINKLSDRFVNNSTLSVTPSSPFPLSSGSLNVPNTSGLKRRRVENVGGAVTRSSSSSKIPAGNLLVGSGDDDSELKSVEAKKVVVASMIHPTTTEDVLLNHLVKALSLNDATKSSIRCSLMLPRGRKIEELDYISFKISVTDSIYNDLLSPTVWPKGVTLREYVPGRNSRTIGSFLPITAPVVQMESI